MYSQQLHQVRKTHIDLARGLGLDGDSILGPLFGELEQMLGDIHQRGRLSPRAKAGVMSLGELMATTIGAAFLSAQGLQCTWMDARDVLRSIRLPGENERSSYLSAVCNIDPEQSVQGCFGRQAGVILTQGFIASNAEGESVLLGRGGSDTSAAYFAAKLSAVGLEIWTDVPGLFSANPRVVSGARLLNVLNYEEAQEIASTGGAVLHPRCLRPVKHHGIDQPRGWQGCPWTQGAVIPRRHYRGFHGDTRHVARGGLPR
jgi:diaminopimelate decarboxylase/aspartate kinase